MIKAIVFDFDGIILESSEIKTAAFMKMFENESEEIQKNMYKYHLNHMGFSRQRKFEYYYTEIKRQAIPKGRITKMSEQYSSLVLSEVIKASFVPGMPSFLDRMSAKYALYIATGTPNDEITTITEKRGLVKYFRGIYGSSATKEAIINIILLKGYHPYEIVFFGDAESDRVSALNAGVHFVGRIAHGSEMMGEAQNKIYDFTDTLGIEKILETISGFGEQSE